MAHTFDTSVTAFSSTNPVTLTFTCGAGVTVLALGIGYNGVVARAGGTPTYNGVAMLQADSTRTSGLEANVELWYMLAPPTGSAHTISIPNSGGLPILACANSAISATGASALDVANGATGASGAPSAAVTTTVNGDFVTGTMASGLGDVTTMTPSHTSIHLQDAGAWGSGTEYNLQTTAGAITLSWTGGSDDWAEVIAAFKEVSAAAGWGMLLSGKRNRLVMT